MIDVGEGGLRQCPQRLSLDKSISRPITVSTRMPSPVSLR